MIKFYVLFNKTVFVALVTALALAALPVTNVYANGMSDPNAPPADAQQLTDERLELMWARMQLVYKRQGRILERANGMVERARILIERMNENGKDSTALQAALDTFEQALQEAQPVYESAKGILNSHQGFDADGKVSDHKMAVETVKALGDKLKEVRQMIGEPGKALHEALKAFRDAHRPSAEPTP